MKYFENEHNKKAPNPLVFGSAPCIIGSDWQNQMGLNIIISAQNSNDATFLIVAGKLFVYQASIMAV